jgi:hypothetical protein
VVSVTKEESMENKKNDTEVADSSEQTGGVSGGKWDENKSR